MTLAAFLINLFEQGNVTVANRIRPFPKKDRQEAVKVLQHFYQQEVLEMPNQAPFFSEEAAAWAAEYLYRAIQLVMLRDLGEEVIEQHLKPYSQPITPQAIVSVDLCFRYLSDLFDLAKGLAPNDPLVLRLKETAKRWPFSSVGMELELPLRHQIILDDHCLRYAYIDRIIKAKDKQRAKIPEITVLIQEALGDYAVSLWPEVHAFIQQSLTQ